MTIREEKVTVVTTDGFEFDAFVAHANGDSKGGLVILQEIFGVTDQLKSVARSYAEDGFDTIVPALFDRVSPQTVIPFDDPDGGRALMKQLDIDTVLLDIDAARDHIDQGNGVSVLGFCFGGGVALKAATSLSLKSAISYYGTKLPGFLDAPPKCPTLFHFGETDMMNTPPEIIEAVQTAIPGAETHIYAAGHAFANDARATYVVEAAIPARERSLAFLAAHHG
ncbi:MAG: carboxymethylenebutenolidase [Paracoccaceae bacterium]|jgi:carboxymethylenebutenolidase